MSTTSETPAATADLAVPTPEHLAPAAPPRGVGAMGPKVDAASLRGEDLRATAEQAQRSGHRVDVMRYLRLRRSRSQA